MKITKCVKVELVKSLNAQNTGAAFTFLRDLRTVSARVMNNALVATLLDVRNGGKGEPYNAVRKSLDGYSAWATAKLAAAPADANDAHLQRYAGLVQTVGSQVVNGWAQQVHTAKKKYFSAKGANILSQFKQGAPIFVRAEAWQLTRGPRTPTFTVQLQAGRTAPLKFAIAASNGSHWALLKRMIEDPTVELGDCKIIAQKNAQGPTKWFAILSHTVEIEPVKALNEKDALIVHRGMASFLTYVTTTGHAGVVHNGSTILAKKQQFKARRKDMGRAIRTIGKGARGHGRNRRYQLLETLSCREKDYTKTACQQAAAAVVRIAIQRGCKNVVIEDYGTIPNEQPRYMSSWPWYALKQAIEWDCTKAGITFVEAPSEYIATECPLCGTIDAANVKAHTNTFTCTQCAYKRDADMVACLNMAKRSGFDMTKLTKQWKAVGKAIANAAAVAAQPVVKPKPKARAKAIQPAQQKATV